MPQVFAAAAIGAGAGAIGLSTATLFGSTIIGGAVLYGGLALVSTLLAPKRPDFSTSDARLKTTLRTGIAPARWVLGRARTAGVLTYILEPTDTDKDLHLILVLCEGQIEGIEKIYADGVEIPWSNGSLNSENGNTIPEFSETGATPNTKYNGRISFHCYYNGIPGDQPIHKVAGSKWTNKHLLTNKTAIHIRLIQPDYNTNSERFYNSVPNFEFLIKGLKITYPNQTEPVWTNNAAAIRYWWLTERRAVPSSAINTASFQKAFDYCGALVDNSLPETYGNEYPNKSPRYMINGIVQSTDDHNQIENEMDFAWAGNVIEVGGKHYFRPGRDDNIGRPITRIEPEDIITRQSIQPAPALTDRINAATMRLSQNSATDYLESGVPIFVDEAGVKRDGSRLSKDLGTRTFVCCPSSAGRLLATTIRRARSFKRYEIVITPGSELERMELMPSDLVIYNDPDLAVENVRCVVVAMQQNPDFSISLTLEQQLNGTHADTAILPPLYGKNRVSSRDKPLPPTGLTATSSVQTTQDNTAQSLIEIGWNPTPHSVLIDIVGPKNLDNIFSNQSVVVGTDTTIIVPFPGEYTIDARNRDRNGNISEKTSIKVNVDWTDIPDAIDITNITRNADGSITITYDTGNTITIGSGKGIASITRNSSNGVVLITYTDGSTDNFTINDGATGGLSEWIYRATNSSTAPTTPTTTDAQKRQLDFVPSGWSDDPPTSGTYIWVSTRKRSVATDPFSDFSAPSPFRGPRGFTGSRGPAGPAAPRVWSLLFEKSVDDNPGQLVSGSYYPGRFTANRGSRTFTLRASMLTYDWIAVFGRGYVGTGHSAFSWSAMIKVSELRAQSTRNSSPYNTLEIQSVNSTNATFLPFIRYRNSTNVDLGVTSIGLADPDGYLDEIWGVNS